MQNQYHSNGHPPPTNGVPSQAQRTNDEAWTHAPTVHQALPFTPFSSIVPFNPEVIPPPLATPYHNPNFDLGDHQRSRRVLDKLSAGASNAEDASKRCQQTIRDVQKLLDSESLTKYHFKRPPHIKPKDPAAKQNFNQHPSPSLSPFAKMVLDSTDVPFRYLTPDSPGTQSSSAVNGSFKTSKPNVHNGVPTLYSNKTASIQPNGSNTSSEFRPSQDFHPGPSSQTLQAVVPTTLSASEMANIPYIADTGDDQSAKPHSVAHNGSRTVSVDQRRQGDAAVAELQQQLDDIFAEDDNFDPHGDDASRILAVAEGDEGRVSILQVHIQEKLDAAVQTVAKFSRLDSLSIQDLVRIQKFNERAVTSSNTLQLQIEEDWSEDDVQYWLSKLGHGVNALLAARTLLRIMNAGRQEKELQSEDQVRAVLDLLKMVIDTGIVPIVEERSFVGEKVRGGDKPQHNPKFVLATNHRSALRALLSSITKSLRLLANLLSKVDVDESAISSVVFMCKSLIFAENAATDKESVLGVQPFESTRKYAMDVLGRIFTRYTDQRQFVIDEILVSLEKLPATKQSARQYRLTDGKPIQLVSALLMRLVQTSATRNSTALHLRTKADEDDEDEDADGSDEEVDDEDDDSYCEENELSSNKRGNPKDLASIYKPLYSAAQSNASHIVRILVNRASTTAKNSDEPFRKLMDIFTEDFLSVLGSTDWPAAEMLLRTLLQSFIILSEDPKKAVPARNLALELMGVMGSGILGLQMHTRNAVKNVDLEESPLINAMVTNFRNAEASNKDLDSSDLLGFNGPYRIVLEYLNARDTGNDAQLQTAKGFLLIQWANQLCNNRASSVGSEESGAFDFTQDMSNKLRNMIIDPQWLESISELKTPSTATGRFASLLVTVNLTFCRAFQRLFTSLTNALADDHTLVKSRAIKSINTVVERDPEVLVRNFNLLSRILGCMNDKSALVRESALTLIQKCLALRPELATHVQGHVEVRASDSMPGVRKKAFKVLKDLYMANADSVNSGSPSEPQLKVRTGVSIALIQALKDSEESVLELVRTILEELWFVPLYGNSTAGAPSTNESNIQHKLKYRLQTQMLTRCVELGRSKDEDFCRHLESLVKHVLTKSKTLSANKNVSKRLIEVLFDGIIDPADIPGTPPVGVIMETLTIFAKVSPGLMEASQLERLEPFTNNLSKNDDLNVYRSVLTILRHAMPVKSLGHGVLNKLQSSLMMSISRLPRTEIAEVAACLWTIDGELKNTERLVNLVASALNNIRSMSQADLSADMKLINRVTKLMNIVGQFGKACDFEPQLATFKDKFNGSKSRSVAGLAVEIICPFTSPKQPLEIREASLDAVCAISQRWPKMFLRSDVGSAFDLILKEKAHTLEEIFVSGLEGFFAMLSAPADSQQEGEAVEVTGRERLARTYVASDQDGASSELAQRFLPDILRLAESGAYPGRGGELALTATKLIASILQQGLPHPKECGPSLIALETSPNTAIAKIAWKEHRAMHQKHETTIEKEYVRSVQRSLAYQQNVTGHLAGFTGSPPKSKLHFFWDVLKTGKLKVRHKFINNICQRLEFESAQLNIRESAPAELLLARYVCENLAFFEYDRIDDLLKLLSAFEKSFASVGTPVAQAIESDILKLNVALMLAPDPMAIGTMTGELDENTINPARLKTLALSSQILLIIWETRTFILRLWNLQKIARSGKAATKENSKAPSRAPNAPTLSDNYIRCVADLMAATATSEQQHSLCERFVEVMSVDSEAKLPSEDEDDLTMGGGEVSGSEGATPPAGGARGKKRKSGGSSQNTPRKKGRPRKSSTGAMVDDREDGGWD